MQVQQAIHDMDLEIPGVTVPMTDAQSLPRAEVAVPVSLHHASSGGDDNSSHRNHMPAVQTHLSRMDIFRISAGKTPTNDFGLPIYLLRPDLIPDDLMAYSEVDQAHIVQSAAVPILFDEGFPTFENGSSIWSRMEFEPDESFELFRKYLEQADKQGARRLEDLAFELGSTSASIAGNIDQFLRTLKEYFTYYNWATRAKAHDMFRVAAFHKLRERRILTTTDKHYLDAEKLMSRLMNFFDKKDEETGDYAWMKDLSAKTAIDMLDKLAKLQRVSIGLSAHGLSAGEQGDAPKNADVEVVLRQLASNAQDPNARGRGAEGQADLQTLLSNPDLAGMAQELIIRVGRGGN